MTKDCQRGADGSPIAFRARLIAMGGNCTRKKSSAQKEKKKKPLDVLGKTLYINETKIEPFEFDFYSLFKKK